MRTLIAFAALALSGCAGSLTLSTHAGQEQAVYQAESDFLAGLSLAEAYRGLPTCTPSVTLCASPSVVAKVSATAVAANAALMTAQGLVRANGTQAQIAAALAGAQSAVQQFTLLTQALK
jgi:hypothetical protein